MDAAFGQCVRTEAKNSISLHLFYDARLIVVDSLRNELSGTFIEGVKLKTLFKTETNDHPLLSMARLIIHKLPACCHRF